MDFLQAHVIRQVHTANAAEQRLLEEVALSGALPGEVGIVWVYRYRVGLVPRLN